MIGTLIVDRIAARCWVQLNIFKFEETEFAFAISSTLSMGKQAFGYLYFTWALNPLKPASDQ